MATETPVLGLELPAANDFYDVEKFNSNFRKIDANILLALAAAAPYSTSQTYALGAYCTRGGKLYKCTTAITSAETWTAAHWTETTMGAELVAISIALQNKAPAGYGLGTFYSTEIDDCDTATKNGWYHVKGATLNKPFNKVGALLVACRGSTQMYQLFFVGETYNTGGSCIIVRSMYGGEWGPWEWVNPPMAPGAEYRTTERYQEKPVYVKVVNFGKIPQSTSSNPPYVAHGIANIKEMVYCSGQFADAAVPWHADGNELIVSANKTNIWVYHPNNGYTEFNVYAILKYTKTTD